MTPEQIFSVVNLVAVVPWILLVGLPGKRWVTGSITGLVVPMLFAFLYVGILVTTLGRTPGGFSSLEAVATLFSNPWALLAGWIHYLAFDLLTGTWEVRDARERGMPHLLVVPCLILTFLFGPAGWLLYIVVRTTWLSQTRQSVSSS